MARKAWLVNMTIDELETYKDALYSEVAAVMSEIELKKVLTNTMVVDVDRPEALMLPFTYEEAAD